MTEDHLVALERWGLRGAEVEAVSGGATNLTWQVQEENERWFLRRYRNSDIHAVRREHRLVEVAAAAGVRTPVPQRCSYGSTIVEESGRLFALFSAVAGDQLEPSSLEAGHAHAAGAFLARLHDAVRSHDGRGLRRWTLRWDGQAWAERVEATAALVPVEGGDETDRWSRRRLLQQAAWLRETRCVHEYVPRSPAQVIHGDFQHANLFFSGTEVTGVIDWDAAAVMPRAFEIARACSFMFQVEPVMSREFIGGYRTVNNIGDEELADGARAWGCFADHHVWPAEERYRNGNLSAARFIPNQPFKPFLEAWSLVQPAADLI